MNHYGTIAGVYHFFWVTSVIVRYAYPPSRGKRFVRMCVVCHSLSGRDEQMEGWLVFVPCFAR
jgi:hypothetical protein